LRYPHGPATRQTIQRKIWRFDGTNWVEDSSDPDDKNPFPDPVAYCSARPTLVVKKHDRYNQETGTYISVAEALDQAQERVEKRKKGKRKRGGNSGEKKADNFGGKIFGGDKRGPTAYGSFSKKGCQGPHSVAHITKRTVFDMGEKMWLYPLKIIDSKLMPEPRRVVKMVEDLLAARSLAVNKNTLYEWYQKYKNAYNKAKVGGRGWKHGLREAMELHPLSVYKVGEEATKAELSRKEEDAKQSMADLRLFLDCDRKLGVPLGVKTVDRGYEEQDWKPGQKLPWVKHYEDFAFNYMHLAIGRPPSPSDYPAAPKSPERDDDDA